MTSEDVITGLKNLRLFMELEDKTNENKFNNSTYESVDMGIEALKKQVAIQHHHSLVKGFNDKNPKMRFSVCPDCLGVIVTSPNYYPSYCSMCGQKIKWGDEE